MASLFTKFCGRASLVAFEALAVVVGLLALGMGLLVWRINAGPLDVTFARDYVEDSMRDPATGYSLNLGRAEISWPDLKGPVRLRLENVNLLKHDRTVLNVGTLELALSRTQMLLGQVAPVGIVLSNPSLRLLRTEDNNIVLSLRDELPDVTAVDDGAAEDNALMNAIRMLAQADGAQQDNRTPFDRLRLLEIRDARMVMEDHARGITWFLPDIDLLFMRDRNGLLLTANMVFPSDPDAPAQVVADIAYNRERDDIGIRLDVANIAPHFIAGKFEALDFLDPHDLTVSGELRMLLSGDLRIEDVTLDLAAAPGALVLPDVYNEPFAFQSLTFAGRYDRDSGALNVTDATLVAQDVTLGVTAALTLDEENEKLEGPVTVTVPTLPQEKITLLWPDSARDESAATWLTEQITGGTFTDVRAQFDIRAARTANDETGDASWDLAADNINGTLAMTGAKVDYRAPLPAATDVSATGVFADDTLTVSISRATIGGLGVGAAEVKLTELIHGTPGGVAVAVELNGPVAAVFDYIRYEPIGMTPEQIGIDTAASRGQAALKVDVSFPALRDLPAEKVKIGVTGTLRDTYVPGVVKDMAVSGGPFALNVESDRLKLSGKGQLDGRDVDFTWDQYFDSTGKPWSGRVEASILADKGLRDKMGVAIDDWLEGAVPVNVTYTDFGAGRAEVAVRADLGPGTVKVEPFRYTKPPGQPGTATADVLLQGGDLQEIRKLTVQTPDLHVDNARLFFRNQGNEAVLTRASFPRATLGESDIALDVEATGANALKVGITGAMFDARPFLNRDADRRAGDPPPPPYAGPALVATVNVARMRTHPGRMIEKAKVYVDMAQNGDMRRLEVDAVAGAGAVYMRLRPDNAGVMTLRLEADDAGAAMNAFGVYENVRGGKLVILGAAPSVQNPRLINGTVQLTDFRAVNAPILARLVGAISPMGLAELLGSDGIFFARLESKFDWHMRREGDLFVVSGGRTSGSSLGLTFEGQIDRAARVVDINGHIVPVSMLNSLISSIPIVGTLLSGGSEGGVFAATYTIRGPQDTPTVSVNPLSVLAPGLLRRLLFESD